MCQCPISCVYIYISSRGRRQRGKGGDRDAYANSTGVVHVRPLTRQQRLTAGSSLAREAMPAGEILNAAREEARGPLWEPQAAPRAQLCQELGAAQAQLHQAPVPQACSWLRSGQTKTSIQRPAPPTQLPMTPRPPTMPPRRHCSLRRCSQCSLGSGNVSR